MVQFWNGKFGTEEFFYGTQPNRYIASQAGRIVPDGRVACLGEGEGRNAVYLAERGHRVWALDASDVGLAKACRLAESRGVTIVTQCMDLSAWTPEEGTLDAVVTSYCHLGEPLRTHVWERVHAALVPGGVFIGEFFSIGQLAYESGGPRDPELLYRYDDVAALLERLAFETIDMEETLTDLDEGIGHRGRGCVVRFTVRKR